MPTNSELNILINTKFEGKGLTDLRQEFNANKKALDEMRRANQQNTQEYKDLIREQGKYEAAIKGLSREYRGLSQQVKTSKFQLLEFGENLTVVTAGVLAVTAGIRAFAKESLTLGADLIVLKSNFKGTKDDLELFGKATTGNLGESALIKLSNRATELGYSMQQQALLFDLAEKAADAYGGSIDENFDRVVNAITKGGKGLESLGISTQNFKQQAEVLSQSLYGLAYKDLDAATKQTVGFKVIIEQTGGSIDTLREKLPDVGDKIANMNRAWEEFKTKLGEAIIKQAEFKEGQEDVAKASGDAGTKIGDFIMTTARFAETIGKTHMKMLTMVSGYDAISAAVQFLIDKTKEWLGLEPIAVNDLKLPSLSERVDAVTSKVIPTIDVSSSQREDKKPKTRSSSSSATKTKEETLNYLADLKRQLSEIDAIISKQSANENEAGGFLLQRSDLELLINYVENLDKLQKITTSTARIKDDKKSGISVISDDMAQFLKAISHAKNSKISATFQTISNAIEEATNSLAAFFGVLASGDEQGDGFKNFMKSIVNTFITSIQAMILAAAAAMSGKAISSFGLSVITDAPLLAAAFASLELAKGIISGLAAGGEARAGRPYIVGEQGRELFVPNTAGRVINAGDFKHMMSSSNNSSSAVYINSNIDFIRFNKVLNAKYTTWKNYKIL